MAERYCEGPHDTPRPAAFGGTLCHGHYKQRERHPDRPLRPLGESHGARYQSRRQRLVACALRLADAATSDENGYEKALGALERAAR